MGLELENPIVVSSCGLSGTADKIAACAEAGAGAVIVKSIFQEEIDEAIKQMDSSSHPESHDYIAEMQTGFDMERYCNTIREAKKRTSVPIIGSVNAFRQEWWVERLPQLAEAGADAIELNLALLPQDYSTDETEIRKWYTDTVHTASQSTKVPLAIKIGPYFTSIPLMVDELRKAGASSVTLFNRFFQFDIDTDNFRLKSASPFSSSADLAMPLRWISLLYHKKQLELAASSGIHTADDLIKVLLAGAQVGQVCSSLYKDGLDTIKKMHAGLTEYMKKHHFTSIEQFRGKVSQSQSFIPEDFERIQYIKTLTGVQS